MKVIQNDEEILLSVWTVSVEHEIYAKLTKIKHMGGALGNNTAKIKKYQAS